MFSLSLPKIQQPADENAPEEDHVACDDQRKPYPSEWPEVCEKGSVEYDGRSRGRCEQDVEGRTHGDTNSRWGRVHGES